MTNGKCTSCVGSLVLVNGECVKKQNDANVQSQSQTTPTQGGVIVINNNNQVTSSSSTQSISTSTKPNTSSSTPLDPNCLKWETNKCIKCSDRFYMNQS